MLKEQELRAKLTEAKKKYDTKESQGVSIEELRAEANVIKELREKLDLAMEMRMLDVPELNEAQPTPVLRHEDFDKEYAVAFVQALRNERGLSSEQKEIIKRASNVPTVQHLKSSVEADGGYLVPKDVETKINEYMRAYTNLEDLVTVVQTNVLSGERTFEKLADVTPLENISEYDVINDIASPTYERKSFKISSFAGILPVPNTLLQDSDVNILNELSKFIARKRVATRNAKIMAKLDEVYTSPVALTNVDGLKDVLNVTLDPVFSASASIVTNQDGFNWLDKQKDTVGNYLLQRDLVDPTKYLFAGRKVIVLPNRVLATKTKKVPMFIGAMDQAVILFDRGVYEVTATNVGGDSFKRNTTDIRVIDRFDVQAWDKDAVVKATVTLA
ncbi:phage major capsid protein [Carnobacteriaceae bacterium zg-ZUI252]|nr:phage major capsid protein [Carnobacteriaceae bacterium zg-ZUI252]